MRFRLCNSPSPSLETTESSKVDYHSIISFSTPNPTMAEAIAASSPASVPSLAATSQASIDGDDSLQLMDEIPATSSSKSYSVTVDDQYMVDSWKAIIDNDEDEIGTKVSRCSSGILSAESLDLDFAETASSHSISSAKTLKSPSGRIDGNNEAKKDAKPKNVDFERVDTDDVPVHRGACHGALNISPKQLAEVFALFSADRKGKENQPPPPPTALASPIKIQQEKQQPEQQQLPEPTETCFVAAAGPAQDDPFSVQERFKSRARNDHPKLTSELYWKPRAKSLEKECETLKEILTDDSSKILQLKSTLAVLRADKTQNLVEMQSVRDQLEATQQELDTLKKEREVLMENEIEYRETIRILKNEVDMLTRDDRQHSPAKEPSTEDQEELKQLRLENQLFAAQIVDYEAELERLEEQVKCSPLEETRKNGDGLQERRATTKDSQDSSPSVERPKDQELLGTDREGPRGDESSIFRALSDVEEEEHKENPQKDQVSVKELVSRLPYVEDVTPSMEEEGIESVSDTLPVDGGKRKIRIAIEKVQDHGRVEDSQAAQEEDQGSNREGCMEKLTSGMPAEFPQQILGNVLGMFAVGGSNEGKDEHRKDEVFVISEAIPTRPDGDSKVPCLQWRSPDQLPTFVTVDNIIPPEKVEDRNPKSTSSDTPLCDKTNLPSPQAPVVTTQQEVKHSGGREDTEIQVLQNVDASQSIEVHLNPTHPNKEGVSTSCKEKCDVWNALSNCPFASESK